MKKHISLLSAKINPPQWIYFSVKIYPFQMDLFSTFFCGKPFPPQVDKFTRVFQKSPLTKDTHPPPPTAPSWQFSVSTAASPKRVPLLQFCLVLSDGGSDVEKYLHRQITAREWSLWRTSMALNLIHSVDEYLSAGSKASSLLYYGWTVHPDSR
jgi:hypothetical protein